jgi:hypothetical protein
MKTSKPLTHQTTLDELIFSQEDSHVNPSQMQDLEKERKTNATYGARCLESFGKFPRATLWAKTFAAYLIGQGEFSSSKCALTWKLKATKLHRIYFQLAVKTLPTEEIEFGLLPTVTTDCVSNRTKNYAQGGTPLTVAVKGLLPTPTSQARERTLEECQDRQEKYGGKKRALYLDHFAAMGMLPTPLASDNGEKVTGLENQMSLTKIAREQTGKTSQLSPLFVEEMMGFPKNWTALPFQSGEKKASKPTVTP